MINLFFSRRFVRIAEKGSDELKYLNYRGTEAMTFPADGTILLRQDPSKAAIIEEFLHGTQSKLGVIDRLGVNASEAHVKNFMIRHRQLLGLRAEDVDRLAQLRDLGL